MSNSALRYQQDYPQRKKKTKNKTDFSQTTYIVPEKHEEERERKLKPLVAKNDHQRETLQAFSEKQMIIQTGSAGVGKTELACWWASKLWLEGKVDTIVITRPHKHLGDDYGAIRGSDAEKLLPFCMSILMKLKKQLGVGILRNNFKMNGFDDLFSDARGIMIVPVEKIQGLSYNNRTIIIADEIQNASISQVKALATRMEEGCQLLICGDPKQTAITGENGLVYLTKKLEKHPHELAQVITYTPKDNCRVGISAHMTRIFEEDGNW